ncbi:permease [Arsenicicoccus dermatophilus]|uniref:permease n=1 Tax=Arsenicicoccus dermatophilus TaxID=1076331 RepID=UPI0039173E4A
MDLSALRRSPLAPALLLLGVLAALAMWSRAPVAAVMSGRPALQAWLTTMLSMSVQALPFLVLGVLLSAAISVLVPPRLLERALPANPVAAVPVAGTAGILLPGCECASVPVSSALMRSGVAPAVALTFQLAAPAVNPVVLASTAVAFGGSWTMVTARFLASWLTAVVVGLVWIRLGKDHVLAIRERHEHEHGRWRALMDELSHDVLQAGGYLVVGAMIAATLNVVVPTEWVGAVAGNPVLSVLALAFLAVIVAVCSEADAFVAAGLSAFSPLAQLAFMVVGPVVDIKLIAMQVGTYGKKFALVFVPLTLVVALNCANWIGTLLL